MIGDIYNAIFTELTNTLSTVTILSSNPKIKPTFPCVVFEEIGNDTDVSTVDSGGDKYSILTYRLNIYSNAENAFTQIRNIRNSIDTILNGKYRMTRRVAEPITNLADESISRYVVLYSFKIDANNKIYKE